ncbi:HMA2 domain-containing protein [Oceanirhabdus sp. W0125-5]|uniref:HMA2 domain-containing protein n=1 Tax=Oceanirhabdus sp. W0125-5 TaxID=2999116 RepID=UPI0022F32FFC|nr:cation transporter [Oceanirhabdus sp. W0125-5]WBW95035.1 cation transporter [Oceanirhabdus sp. W0125-5]
MIFNKVLDFAIKIKVIHSIPGRLRINAPAIKQIPKEWQIQDENITSVFLVIKGVKEVSFSYLTGNVVIKYDPQITNEKKILKAVRRIIQIVISYRKEIENITIDELKDEIARMALIVKDEMSK